MTEGVFVFIRCSKLIFLNSTLSQVTINQSKIGEVVQQKPVWSVAITNGCPCSQLDMKLSSNGFHRVSDVLIGRFTLDHFWSK